MTITTKDLTGGEITGAGFYDELMRTSKAHLVEEYEAGRLVGADYGSTYLGMLQANLQVASQFILQKEINNQQVLLLQEQVQQAAKENALLNLQLTKAGIENNIAQYNLDYMLPEQLATQTEQTKLVTAQIAESNAKTTLLGTQNSVTAAESTAKLANLAKQDDLLDKQILTETANTSMPTAGLTLNAYNKGLAEISILNQKKLTEEAQISGTPAGLLGKEMALKDAQANSFKRDAEQKAAKFYADTFAIMYSTDSTGVQSSDWHLGYAQAQQVMDKLIAGIS